MFSVFLARCWCHDSQLDELTRFLDIDVSSADSNIFLNQDNSRFGNQGRPLTDSQLSAGLLVEDANQVAVATCWRCNQLIKVDANCGELPSECEAILAHSRVCPALKADAMNAQSSDLLPMDCLKRKPAKGIVAARALIDPPPPDLVPMDCWKRKSAAVAPMPLEDKPITSSDLIPTECWIRK